MSRTPETVGKASATVTGTVTYRQRIALPPNAKIEVKLQDVSRADAPAMTIAEQTITADRQVPIPFSLSYDPATIIPNHSYSILARITVEDKPLFVNTTSYAVITRANPSTVEVVLEMVR